MRDDDEPRTDDSTAEAAGAVGVRGRIAGPRLQRMIARPLAALTALLVLSALLALSAPSVAMARRSSGVRCQHRHGHTILRQGVIRVFRAPGGVYGCVKGRRNKVFLWQDHHKLGEYSSGSVSQAAGHFLAIQSSSGDQYAYDTSLEVVNLRTGASYAIASESEPISGPATGNPSTPGPWPIQAFVLGSDGRTARLYETFPASSTQGYNTPPSGQVLDVIGFHHFRVQLATSQPGGIAPSSLAYHGHTVTWTQNGVPHSASD